MKKQLYKKLQMLALSLILLGFGMGQVQAQNTALDFDGSNDYIGLGNPTALNFTNNRNFTIEAWIKPSTVAPVLQSIISKLTDESDKQYSLSVNASGIIQFYYEFNANEFNIFSPANTIVAGTWQHVSVTVDNSLNCRIYVDGVEVASGTAPNQTSSVTNPVEIGRWGGVYNNSYFGGDIDEVRIWNVARSATDIANNRNTELIGNEAGLVAYYDFQEGVADANNTGITAPEIQDQAGTNHGTMNGFTKNGTTSNWVGSFLFPAEINLQGNGIDIADGENAPSTAKNTDFGVVGTAGKALDYTIQNTDLGALSITGIASDNTDFVISGMTFPATIAGGSSATFTITFMPTGANGIKTANISIANNDADENPYNFAIEGYKVNETPSPVRGNMLSLDGGNDRVNLGNPAALDLTSNFTIEAWIKPSSVTLVQGIITKLSSAVEKQYALFITSTGQILFDYETGANNFTLLGGSLTANTWYHISVTVGTGPTPPCSLYINGILVDTDTAPAQTLSFAEPIIFGRKEGNYPSTQYNHFGGSMDEIRFWNTALTQDQIRENMHLTLKGSETGLVGYYQFNEDTGDVIDKINGNNGTLLGLPTLPVRAASTVSVAAGSMVKQTVSAAGLADFGNFDVNFTAISSPAAGDEFVAYQLYEAPYNNVSALNTSSNYWIIRKFGAQTFSVNAISVKIPNSNEISTDDEANPANLKLYKRVTNSADAAWATDPVGEGNAANNTTKVIDFTISTPITSFSEFIVASGNSSLPVSLISFEATRQYREEVQLTWATASEIDNLGFEVEMSEDGQSFEQVGFVEGKGNSNQIVNYQFTLDNPKAVYYRLKQVDINSSFAYSQVRFVSGIEAGAELMISPNPSQGEVNLSLGNDFSADAALSIQLLDVRGQVLLSTKSTLSEANQSLNARLNRAAKGLYFIQIQTQTGRFVKRIILN